MENNDDEVAGETVDGAVTSFSIKDRTYPIDFYSYNIVLVQFC